MEGKGLRVSVARRQQREQQAAWTQPWSWEKPELDSDPLWSESPPELQPPTCAEEAPLEAPTPTAIYKGSWLWLPALQPPCGSDGWCPEAQLGTHRLP